MNNFTKQVCTLSVAQSPSSAHFFCTQLNAVNLGPKGLRNIALSLFVLTSIQGCQSSSRPAMAAQQTQVAVYKVESQSRQNFAWTTGKIEPLKSAVLKSQVSAKVLRRLVELGDAFGPGQVLMELDESQVELQLEQAQAAKVAAQADVQRNQAELFRSRSELEADLLSSGAGLSLAEADRQKSQHQTRPQELLQSQSQLAQAERLAWQAQQDYIRYDQLWHEGAISDQQHDRYLTEQRVANERLEVAKQSLKLAEEGARREDQQRARAGVDIASAVRHKAASGQYRVQGLQAQSISAQAQAELRTRAVEELGLIRDRHHLKAPFSGRVLEIMANEGDLLSPGSPAVKIGQLDQVKVTFQVSEKVRVNSTFGQRVDIQVDALPKLKLDGKITKLGFSADPKSHLFQMEVWLDNPNYKLLPNMIARLRLPSDQVHPTIQIPLTSVLYDRAASYVLVVDKGMVQRRDVVLGSPTQAQVQIIQGLVSGDEVVTEPSRLAPGQNVVATPVGAGGQL
jgi:RND family efflux transporter MFP subunit